MTLAKDQPVYSQRRNAEKRALARVAERRSKLKRFGITPEQYAEMLAAQGGVCAICGEPETLVDPKKGLRRLAVDHDHVSGRVRGLLCANCNNGLGRFKDSPILIAAALAYLDT